MLLGPPVAFGQSDVTDGASSAAPNVIPATTQASQGDSSRLSVNPVTGQTTALASDYTPLTTDELSKLYIKQSYWSVGAYFGPFVAALLIDQTAGQPRQWGGGFPGYGRRVASRVASGDVVQNSFQFPVAFLLKEDVRYIASDQHGVARRAGHAILYSFLTYNYEGHPTLNLANIGSNYVAAAVSTAWLPGHRKLASYTFGNGSEELAMGIPLNLIQEFWPEINRAFFHRH